MFIFNPLRAVVLSDDYKPLYVVFQAFLRVFLTTRISVTVLPLKYKYSVVFIITTLYVVYIDICLQYSY